MGNDTYSFSVTLNFEKGSSEPSKAFSAISIFIASLHKFEVELAKSISVYLDSEPSWVLEDIEAGSIRANIRSMLHNIPDSELKDMKLRRIVGTLLVKAKYVMLRFLGDGDAHSEEGLTKVTSDINTLVAKADVFMMPSHRSISPAKIGDHLVEISKSLYLLGRKESLVYSSGQDIAVEINKADAISTNLVEKLLTHNSIENIVERILIIKRPDLLGNSLWHFRWNGQQYEAHVEDSEWLQRFKNGHIRLASGDALHAHVEEICNYTSEGELLSQANKIVTVLDIVRPNKEYSLMQVKK